MKKISYGIIGIIIIVYFGFGILYTFLSISVALDEYGENEMIEYYGCGGTKTEQAWCLFKQHGLELIGSAGYQFLKIQIKDSGLIENFGRIEIYNKNENTEISDYNDQIEEDLEEENYIILSGTLTGENFRNNWTLQKQLKNGKNYNIYNIEFSGDEMLLYPNSMTVGFYSDSESIGKAQDVEEYGSVFFPTQEFVFSSYNSELNFDIIGTQTLDNIISCRNSGPYLKIPSGTGEYRDLSENGMEWMYTYENRINHEVGWTPENFNYPNRIPEHAHENCIIEFDYPENFNLPFSLGEGLKKSIISHTKEKGQNTHCGRRTGSGSSYQLISGNIICDINLGLSGTMFDYFDVN